MSARRSPREPANRELPDFIEPMLAKTGKPFDSDEYLFEVKWDGTRCLAFLDGSRCRLLNRRRVDMTERYPEFACFQKIAPGAVMDGEIVVLKDGKPDFGLLMQREQARTPFKIRQLVRALPATYIAFDLLFEGYRSIMSEPLTARRERLQAVVAACIQPSLVLSEAIAGQGNALFDEVSSRGIEGIMAKRARSPYQPGKRTDAWIKIKRGELVHCAIIGFQPEGKDDFRNLIIAADHNGVLQHVGQVGSGFNAALRKKLNTLIYSRLRAKPILPCKIKGKWIEPGLFCLVHCMERTADGHLRAPAFKELVEG